MGLNYSSGGHVHLTLPPPEKRRVLQKYSPEKTNGTYTVTDTVPAGEQWVIQAVSCYTDRTVKSVTLGGRDSGGHITELASAENVRFTSIRWSGEVILAEGEAIVMVVENNPGNPGANAKLTYRGFYE